MSSHHSLIQHPRVDAYLRIIFDVNERDIHVHVDSSVRRVMNVVPGSQNTQGPCRSWLLWRRRGGELKVRAINTTHFSEDFRFVWPVFTHVVTQHLNPLPERLFLATIEPLRHRGL